MTGQPACRVITLQTLSHHTYREVEETQRSGLPTVVTHCGRFVAVIWPLDNRKTTEAALKRLVETGQITPATASGESNESLNALRIRIDAMVSEGGRPDPA
jgi:antitoxin (DNA-binding transcriptional repressor) of toxin-antitoxin stability system